MIYTSITVNVCQANEKHKCSYNYNVIQHVIKYCNNISSKINLNKYNTLLRTPNRNKTMNNVCLNLARLNSNLHLNGSSKSYGFKLY